MWDEIGHVVVLLARAAVALLGIGVLVVSLLLGVSWLAWQRWKDYWNGELGHGRE